MSRRASLRNRLALGIILCVATLSVLELYTLQRSLRATITQAHDRLLAAATYSIADSMHLESGQIRATFPLAVQEAFESAGGGRVWYRVASASGEHIAGDARPAELPDPTTAGAAPIQYFDTTIDDVPVRAAVLRHPMEMSEGQRVAVILVAHTARSRTDAIRSALLSVALRQGLFLLVACAAIFAVVRWLLRPMDHLRAQVDARRADDFSPLQPIDLKELDPVVAALNGLLARLGAMQAGQERFVANASHQLRTPLTVLKVQLQSALREPAEASRRLGEMLHAVDRAGRLIDQLLALTRIHQAETRREPASTRLRAAVDEAIVELSPLIADRGIAFSYSADTDAEVRCSVWMLGELVRNLLLNAIQHTPPGGELRVEIAAAGRGVECRVVDSGPGIAADQLPALFEPFSTMMGRKGGSGLGLAICKEICDAIGAQLTVRNRIDRHGLEAVIRFGEPPSAH